MIESTLILCSIAAAAPVEETAEVEETATTEPAAEESKPVEAVAEYASPL
jgi:hypothetical protein